jgi:deoxyguanosine kinase
MGTPLYVAVEGPIGVGKTTLVRLLQERMNARLVLENFEENPFLADFYTDRDRYAFQTQIFFLMSRFRQQSELIQPDLFRPSMIADYHLLKDRIFAQLTLSGEELTLYETVYRSLENQILKPDVLIYLHAGQRVLLERIQKRGREFETDFDPEYLMSLSERYQEFFATYDDTPLLAIDTSTLNVPESSSVVEEIYQKVVVLAERGRNVSEQAV